MQRSKYFYVVRKKEVLEWDTKKKKPDENIYLPSKDSAGYRVSHGKRSFNKKDSTEYYERTKSDTSRKFYEYYCWNTYDVPRLYTTQYFGDTLEISKSYEVKKDTNVLISECHKKIRRTHSSKRVEYTDKYAETQKTKATNVTYVYTTNYFFDERQRLTKAIKTETVGSEPEWYRRQTMNISYH